MKKIYITALVIVLVIITIIVFNANKKSQVEFYVSKYSPNSLADFVCKSEGLKDGNKCRICEDIFKDIDGRRKELNIGNDLQFVEKVKEQNKDCVNKIQGGN